VRSILDHNVACRDALRNGSSLAAFAYDFDPRTQSQKSGMTRSNQGWPSNGRKSVREGVDVVCANP
jgi:hypothetical protein